MPLWLRDSTMKAGARCPLAISGTGAVTPESLFEGVMIQQMVLKRDQQLAEWLP